MIYFTFLNVQKCVTLLMTRLFTLTIKILALLLIDWNMTVFYQLNRLKIIIKCHLLVSGHKHKKIWATFGQSKTWESRKLKLLGVKIDGSLNFDLYVSSICEKAGKRLSVLAQLSTFMSLNQR